MRGLHAQVTLIPRGQARGLTWFIPGEDPTLISKQQIFARIVGALGGRAAEEVIFGDAEVTTGASSDLQQVRGWLQKGWPGSVKLVQCQSNFCAELPPEDLVYLWFLPPRLLTPGCADLFHKQYVGKHGHWTEELAERRIR